MKRWLLLQGLTSNLIFLGVLLVLPFALENLKSTALMASQMGVAMEATRDFLEELNRVRLWDGTPIMPGMHTLLIREQIRLELVRVQIHEIEVVRKGTLRTSQDPAIEQVRRLIRLKGIGVNSAWVYGMEFFAWRAFRNRRELGSLSGLTHALFEW